VPACAPKRDRADKTRQEKQKQKQKQKQEQAKREQATRRRRAERQGQHARLAPPYMPAGRVWLEGRNVQPNGFLRGFRGIQGG
jgi:hypothetical protein